MQVMTAGKYDVTLMYTSRAAATVKLSLGTYQTIKGGTAATITAQLPRQVGGCCRLRVILHAVAGT
jgi:hypothetical protein